MSKKPGEIMKLSAYIRSCDSLYFPIVTYIRVKLLFEQEKM